MTTKMMKLMAGAAMVAAGVMTANAANVEPAMSVARPGDAPLTLELPDADGAPLVLVPYGCTKLRIFAFAVR